MFYHDIENVNILLKGYGLSFNSMGYRIIFKSWFLLVNHTQQKENIADLIRWN